MSSVADLTSAELSKIVQAIDDTRHELKEVNTEIEELLNDRFDLEKKVLNLKKLSSEIGSIQDHGSVLTKQIQRTGLAAESISKQVRLLDRAQSNVQSALTRVSKMIELKAAVTAVDRAFNKDKDYETAAKTCHDILSRDKAENLGFESVDQTSYVLLLELQENVRKVVEEECQKACNAENIDSVIKFARMYAYLDNRAEGLKLHSACLAKILRKHYQENALVLTSSYGDADHMTMIEQITEALFEKFPVWATEIEEIYGVGAALQLCRDMQSLISEILGPIAKQYYTKKILPVVKSVKSAPPDSKPTYDIHDVKEILEDCTEYVLNDLVSCDFLVRKNAESALISLNETDNPAQFSEGAKTPLPVRTYLDDQIGNLVESYTRLEHWLCQEFLKRAISKNENPPDELTSTVVMDTFSILQQAAARAFKPHHIDAVCTVVNHIKGILDGEDSYFDLLREDLENLQRTRMAALWNQQQAEEDEALVYVALNNVSRSAQHISSLKEILEDKMQEDFGDIEQKEKRKLSFLLDDFDVLVKKFDGLAEDKMRKHFENYQKRFVDDVIVDTELNYQLSEQEFGMEQMKFTFVDKFKRGVEKPLADMREKFTEENFRRFANILLLHLVETIVEKIKKHKFGKFTNWGGMLLQGQIRTLTSYFNDNYDLPGVREKFSRLRNIVELLQIKELAEVTIFLSQPKVDPRFVKQILRLRIDFSQEQIDRL